MARDLQSVQAELALYPVGSPNWILIVQEILAILAQLNPPAPAPAPAPTGKRLRGARPTPRHKLAAATPHHPVAGVPASFGVLPLTLNMFGNDTYGDCVTAEEAASKMAYSVWAGGTQLLITDQTAIGWAKSHGVLNGADLTDVLTWMQTDGMTAEDGKVYTDGPHQSVDWTNDTTLRSAIFTGPVKIGVAADQLEDAVNSTNGKSGWIASNFQHDGNEDHCTALWGFGTLAQLIAMMNAAYKLNLTAPAGVDPTTLSYLFYTWQTVGIITQASLLNITGEAWLRTPTTPQAPAPTPPTPAPVPVPPTPVPVPPAPVPPAPVPPAPVGISGTFLTGASLSENRKTATFTNGILTGLQ